MLQRTKISEYISTNQAFHDQKAAKQAAQAAKAANADEWLSLYTHIYI